MLHPYLRSKTDDEHQQLEKLVGTLLKEVRSEETYSRLLIRMADYLIPLEKTVLQQPIASLIPDITDRQRSGQLLEDIHRFEPDWQPCHAVRIPPISSSYQALGALYVLEGSTMGGPIIARMVRQQTGLTRGLSYFESYGDERKKKWNRFREYLELPALYQYKDAISNTAILSFRYYKNWLEAANPFDYATSSNSSV